MDPIPHKDDPQNKPPRRDLADFDPAEREFWDTADDEEDDHQLPDLSQDILAEPSQEEVEHEDVLEEDLEDKGAEEEQDDRAAPAETAAEEAEEPADPPPDPASDRPGRRSISRTDLVWLGVLGIVLLFIAIYGLGLFFKNVQPSGSPDRVDFPVSGDQIVIGKVETFWRKPDRKVDKVSLDAKLIPCAVVKLKSGSGSGRLRLFFENEEGEYVGDPITLPFSGGIFESSGAAEISLHGTEGFEHEGQYAAYVTENFEFWYLNIFEGPASDQDGGQFEKLTRVRISPRRR